MIRAYSSATIRAAEEPLLRAGVPLMQRASVCLALAMSRRWGTYGATILLLPGPGNNGADALYAGAYLARRGASVWAVDSEAIHATAKKDAESAGVRFIPRDEVEEVAKRCDIWVDALLGIGAKGAVREPLASLIRTLIPLRVGKRVVAVDIPSGVECDTGALLGDVLRADLTVTMGAPKPALYLEPSRRYAGEVEVARIGIFEEDSSRSFVRDEGSVDDISAVCGGSASVHDRPALYSIEEEDVRALWPRPGPDSHKYTRGVVGVQAGSVTYPGAGILAVEAALAPGPGMVRYVGPHEVAQQVLTRCPEVVVGPGRVNAWVIGPGLDAQELIGARERYLQLAAQGFPVPVVLDAGAIPFVCEASGPQVILTPHAGEMEELCQALHRAGRDTGCEIDKGVKRRDIEACPARYARMAAQVTGAIVVLKGSVDVVCAPDGTMFAQSGPSWRATAGAGDVLAGLIGAALAVGISPLEAAACAAYLHGDASKEGPMRASILPSCVSSSTIWDSSRV